MDKKAFSERDICAKYITLAVEQAGCDLQSQVRKHLTFSAFLVMVRVAFDINNFATSPFKYESNRLDSILFKRLVC